SLLGAAVLHEEAGFLLIQECLAAAGRSAGLPRLCKAIWPRSAWSGSAEARPAKARLAGCGIRRSGPGAGHGLKPHGIDCQRERPGVIVAIRNVAEPDLARELGNVGHRRKDELVGAVALDQRLG